MTKDFNDWWDSDLTPMDNPYREDTPAYWAWAGWVAGAKAEREACAALFDDHNIWDEEAAAIIRAKGESINAGGQS